MALVLEIEYLLGISFAALGPDSAAPDWPPQPDRVFSALVASWAARGQRASERAALEWLEKQPAPLIDASAFNVRPAPRVFVPPNDPASRTVGDLTVMPAFRRRQPRRFPAALPADPTVRLVWPDASNAPMDALNAMAQDTAAVGHSASLTRCRFVRGEIEAARLRPARRSVYRGRLRELETAFAAGRRPVAGAPVRPTPVAPAERTNAFGDDWLTFEILDGTLDARAAPLATKALRDAIMAGYGRTGAQVPAWVSGHAANGAPTRDPHLAVVPLTFAGYPHADGSLMGLAVVPPSGRGSLLDDDAFLAALDCVTTAGRDGPRTLALTMGQAGVLTLGIALEVERPTLDPARYLGPARTWSTVTPLVLDRHLKSREAAAREEEAISVVAGACQRIGLPRPAQIVLGKHPAVLGAVSAYPSGRAPAWTGWRVPEHVAGRPLTHATIVFETPVDGPVLIGAGRFCGLGFCLPLDAEQRG